jgi:hypothetical protein
MMLRARTTPLDMNHISALALRRLAPRSAPAQQWLCGSCRHTAAAARPMFPRHAMTRGRYSSTTPDVPKMPDASKLGPAPTAPKAQPSPQTQSARPAPNRAPSAEQMRQHFKQKNRATMCGPSRPRVRWSEQAWLTIVRRPGTM